MIDLGCDKSYQLIEATSFPGSSCFSSLDRGREGPRNEVVIKASYRKTSYDYL